jgi:hypothetical protein
LASREHLNTFQLTLIVTALNERSIRGCVQRYARSAQEGILEEIPHNLPDVLMKRAQTTLHTAS